MQKFTTAEAAELLGVKPSRVRQLIAEFHLSPKRFGRDLCLTDAEVAILRTRRTKRGPVPKAKAKTKRGQKLKTDD